jgi:hypothetical protein
VYATLFGLPSEIVQCIIKQTWNGPRPRDGDCKDQGLL